MRGILSLFLLLAACGQATPPPDDASSEQSAANSTWFICDALDAPVVLAFQRDGDTAHVAQYEKPTGAIVQRTDYQIGDEEGAAGSVYTTLLQNGAEAGAIRQLNPGMLETPGAAYTLPYSSVRLGEREISCRWMPRTRLMGFTGRRTIVVSEDQDGDLLYHSYDFASAASAQAIDLAENGRTTTFSLEARGGREEIRPNAVRYSFQADTETTITVATENGMGRVEVRRHGPQPVQSEDLIAYVEGDAAE